jgi:heme/copper-type cytochrome/quinol oxidase subunit 2
MKNNTIFRTLFALLAAVTATAAIAADPPTRTFDVAITNGSVAKEQRLIRVDKGTPVKLRVSSDTAGSLHLHAYKLEVHVAPGTPAELAFNARATGRFRFEWHADNAPAKSGDHHGPPLATLEVRPK